MNNKLMYLEGLRGLAAVFVVLSHFFQIYFPALLDSKKGLEHYPVEKYISDYPINILYNGTFAVCLFFVLSGYVLSIKYHRYKDNEIIVSSFAKRYFRLLFPVMASLFLAFILMKLHLYFFDDIKMYTKSTMLDPYSQNIDFLNLLKLMFIGVFLNGEATYNPVLWTMKYELVGSFLVFFLLPFIVFIKNKFFKAILILFLMIILYKIMGLYFIAFLFGVLFCNLQFNESRLFKNINPIILFILACIGIYLASYPYTETNNTMYGWLDFINNYENPLVLYRVIGAILLLYVVLNSSVLQKFFGNKFFENLGRLSFSLYLTHFIILCSFSSYIFWIIYDSIDSYLIAFIFTVLFSIPVMYVAAELMYHFIDNKSIKWSNDIYKHFVKPVYLKLIKQR